MKHKLLTISIIVLLLCAMVPAAASAAKDKTTLKANVYTIDRSTDPRSVGDCVGKVTYNPTTGAYTLIARDLVPGQLYSITITDHPPGKGRSLFSCGFFNILPDLQAAVRADANGNIVVEGSSTFLTRGLVEQGSVFIIDPYTPPPPRAIITVSQLIPMENNGQTGWMWVLSASWLGEVTGGYWTEYTNGANPVTGSIAAYPVFAPVVWSGTTDVITVTLTVEGPAGTASTLPVVLNPHPTNPTPVQGAVITS